MAFATAKDLVAASRRGDYYPRVADEAEAQAQLDAALQQALNNKQNCKDNRPWRIVDFKTKLDKNQPWIGFEFETGFDSKQDYQKFINFLWQQDYVAIDREGAGKYPVEVAFPPQTAADVLAGEALLCKSVQFMADSGLTPALNPTTFTCRDVGIHAGISTPKFRKAGRDTAYTAVCALDRIIQSLNRAQKEEVYGRSALLWGGAHFRHSYVEIKVFRAIPEVEYVKRVAAVAVRMTTLLDWCLDHPNEDNILNAYEFLSGRDEAPNIAG